MIDILVQGANEMQVKWNSYLLLQVIPRFKSELQKPNNVKKTNKEKFINQYQTDTCKWNKITPRFNSIKSKSAIRFFVAFYLRSLKENQF